MKSGRKPCDCCTGTKVSIKLNKQINKSRRKKQGWIWRISSLSSQRLSATIILLSWDFRCELCNGNASPQITTWLFCLLALLPRLRWALGSQTTCFTRQRRSHKHPVTRRVSVGGGEPSYCHVDWVTDRCCCVARESLRSNMKYKKFITIMQAALGVAPLNKRELIPPPRKLWKPARWVRLCVRVVNLKTCFHFILFIHFRKVMRCDYAKYGTQRIEKLTRL